MPPRQASTSRTGRVLAASVDSDDQRSGHENEKKRVVDPRASSSVRWPTSSPRRLRVIAPTISQRISRGLVADHDFRVEAPPAVPTGDVGQTITVPPGEADRPRVDGSARSDDCHWETRAERDAALGS